MVRWWGPRMDSFAAFMGAPGPEIRPEVVRIVPKGRTRPAAEPRARDEGRPAGAIRCLLAGSEPPSGRLSGPEGTTAGRERFPGEGSAVALFRGASRCASGSTRAARHCRARAHSDGREIGLREPHSAGKRLFQKSAHTSNPIFRFPSRFPRSQRPYALDRRGSFAGRSASADPLRSELRRTAGPFRPGLPAPTGT